MSVKLPRIGWTNNNPPALNANNLNKMEQNVEDAINDAVDNGWYKTFTIPEIKTDDNNNFHITKRGHIVEITAWISMSTFSQSLNGWMWNDSFKSSIKLPSPLKQVSYPFIPDGYSNLNLVRYFQINNGYLYLYNRSITPLTNISQGGLHIIYLTDKD